MAIQKTSTPVAMLTAQSVPATSTHTQAAGTAVPDNAIAANIRLNVDGGALATDITKIYILHSADGSNFESQLLERFLAEFQGDLALPSAGDPMERVVRADHMPKQLKLHVVNDGASASVVTAEIVFQLQT